MGYDYDEAMRIVQGGKKSREDRFLTCLKGTYNDRVNL